jgi:metallophosphoesterase (TIGR00282 family)
MKILAIGDIVGTRAIDHLQKHLWKLRDRMHIDFVIANGENATEIHGLSSSDAQKILDSGVDLITMGNHTWSKRDLYPYLDNNPEKIIRPANYPGSSPGCGYTISDVCGYRMLCMNVQGVAFMEALSDPFDTVEYILAREDGEYDISFLDFHAEATSEKYAMARVFDGKINMIVGTHTHVPTADTQILPGGTAYVTDLGMTGPRNGILGTDTERVLRKTRQHLPSQFIVADGEIRADAVLFELDGEKVQKITRIEF